MLKTQFDDYIVSIGDMFLVNINGLYNILVCTGVSERKKLFRLTSRCYLDEDDGEWVDYVIINDYEYYSNLKKLFSGRNALDYTIIEFNDCSDTLHYYLEDLRSKPELFL